MSNGNVIGAVNNTSTASAFGIWTLEEQAASKVTDTWPAPGPLVSGGILTYDANYYYRTFTGTDSLVVSRVALSADYIIIAGGGGAGGNGGGGGGAGGVVFGSTTFNPGSYTVTVGGGGGYMGSGGNSSITGLTAAIGGGRGTDRDSGQLALTGGSGGGGGGNGSSSRIGVAGTAGQGNRGGDGYGDAGGQSSGGGGGGYSSAGGNGQYQIGGSGGNGYSIGNWSSATGYTGYAGGGCGSGLDYSGFGGRAGTVQAGYGGGGPQNANRDGRVNSGGGGGGLGTGSNSGDSGGGSGGSGIVIIRYAKVDATAGYTGQWAADPYASSLRLALPFDKESGFRDYAATIKGSGTNKTTSPENTALISYNTSKYYGTSANLEPYNSKRSVRIANDSSFWLTNQDFTIEMWAYFSANNVGYQAFASHSGDTGDAQSGWVFILENNNTMAFYASGGWALAMGSSATPVAGNWSHLAVSRSSNTTRMFLNGTVVATNTATVNISSPSSQTLRIGNYQWFPGGERGFSGYIQDFRLYVGAGKYTGNFTPPERIRLK